MLKYSTGLRDQLNGLEATIKGAIIGAALTIVDGGTGVDSITDSVNRFITKLFAPGDKLFVQGATTSGNDTGLTGQRILTVTEGAITVPTGTVANGEAGAAGTVVAVAKGGSLKDIMKDGKFCIYSGSQPADADTAVSGTLLMTITVGRGAWVAGAFDNGLEFENDPLSGEIEKNSEIWSGIGLANGTAGWFRFYANPTDAGTASTTLARIDGSVGTAGSDLVLASTAIVTGRTITIDSFKITLPAYYGA
jgi:hypothetical protein